MRLEPIAGKLARWVLRGGSGSNAASLPDYAPPRVIKSHVGYANPTEYSPGRRHHHSMNSLNLQL